MNVYGMDAIREIVQRQIEMIYDLFLNHFQIPKVVLVPLLSGEVSKFAFYFPDDYEYITDHRMTVSIFGDDVKIATEKMGLNDLIPGYGLDIVKALNGDRDTDELAGEIGQETMEMILADIFGPRATSKWDLDDVSSAVLINTDSLLSVSIILYDVYNQLASVPKNQIVTPVAIKVGGFPNIKKDRIAYSIFMGTIIRYLQHIYKEYGITVYEQCIIGCRNGTDLVLSHYIRSMDDNTDYENLAVDKSAFFFCEPDF